MEGGSVATDTGPTRRALIAAAPALAIAACARRLPDDALRFWAMSYEGDYSPHLMQPFTRATGIDVAVQSLPWTAAHEKLLTAFAGDALPDVMMLPGGWIGEFAMVGAIAPVAMPSLLANLVPGAASAIRYGGRDYGVPWSAAPQVQFYRRDLVEEAGFDAPPTDWEGWRRIGFALKRRRPGEFAFLMLLNWFDTLFTFIGQTGAWPLADNDTRGAFRQPAIRAAFAFYASLFADGLAPTVLSTEVQDPLAAFAQGLFAIWPSGPTLLLDLHRRESELPRDAWAAVRMPGPDGPGAASSISATLAVSARSRRPDAAWALVRHLTSAASELRFQRLIGNLPTNAAAWSDPQLAAPVLAPFAAQMRDTATSPQIPEWERIRIEAQLTAERIVRGLTGLDAGLSDLDNRVDRILAKRRALVEAGQAA